MATVCVQIKRVDSFWTDPRYASTSSLSKLPLLLCNSSCRLNGNYFIAATFGMALVSDSSTPILRRQKNKIRTELLCHWENTKQEPNKQGWNPRDMSYPVQNSVFLQYSVTQCNISKTQHGLKKWHGHISILFF